MLATVERAASTALGEMRALVGVLRDGSPVERAPGHDLADLRSLASEGDPGGEHGPSSPRVVVKLPAQLDVPASVSQAVFRVAQEAVTNARWHAHRAGTVTVTVTVSDDEVRLEVVDDGTPGRPSARGHGSGYGIVGMTERVKALGGTFTAGPQARGWRVSATIPTEAAR